MVVSKQFLPFAPESLGRSSNLATLNNWVEAFFKNCLIFGGFSGLVSDYNWNTGQDNINGILGNIQPQKCSNLGWLMSFHGWFEHGIV